MLATEIADDREAALEQFTKIAGRLSKRPASYGGTLDSGGLDTMSERLFVAFCAQRDIPCVRIETASEAGERRPDFRLTGNTGALIATEVKQFDPSPEEAALIKRSLAGEVVLRGGVPGARLREVIDRANAQLKALSGGVQPGLLVVYNNVSGSFHHTDPYAVLTAMRGLDVVPVVVPPDPNESPTFLPMRPGPKKKLRADANTHISAIAILSQPSDETLYLAVYHNPHARVALDRAGLNASGIGHFVMREDQSDWVRLA